MNTVTSNKKKEPEEYRAGDIFKSEAYNKTYHYILCHNERGWLLASLDSGEMGLFCQSVTQAITGAKFVGRKANINITFN